jgi:hypothetical protein
MRDLVVANVQRTRRSRRRAFRTLRFRSACSASRDHDGTTHPGPEDGVLNWRLVKETARKHPADQGRLFPRRGALGNPAGWPNRPTNYPAISRLVPTFCPSKTTEFRRRVGTLFFYDLHQGRLVPRSAAQVASGNAIPTPRSESPDTVTRSAGAQRTYLTHDIAYIQRRARARPL